MMAYEPDLIVTLDNRNDVIADLIAWGHSAAAVMIASNVRLANLYHETGPLQNPSPSLDSIVNTATARAVIATIAALASGDWDRGMIQEIIKAELDARPPMRLEVMTPQSSVILDTSAIHHMTQDVLETVALNHPVMMVGPAGCGKTTIGEHVARALALPFMITSTINETHELIGFTDGHGTYHPTPFRVAFECGGLWIADEIDAWDAAALLTANSALANGFCTFPDQPTPIVRHPSFRMVATANTFGTGADRVYVGRNELDAASLDRFAVIEIDYDINLERMFAGSQHKWLDRVWDVRKAVNDKRIRHVVSSRAIRFGAEALSSGIAWSKVEARYLFKGMSAKDKEKIDG